VLDAGANAGALDAVANTCVTALGAGCKLLNLVVAALDAVLKLTAHADFRRSHTLLVNTFDRSEMNSSHLKSSIFEERSGAGAHNLLGENRSSMVKW
jgi:hypothetical protein